MPLLGRKATVGNAAAAAAPGAGAAVVTIAAASLPQGTYMVSVDIGILGTPAAADDANMQLQAGSNVVSKLASLGVAGFNSYVLGPYQVTVDGQTALSVNAIGAATAGTRYVACIRATMLEVS